MPTSGIQSLNDGTAGKDLLRFYLCMCVCVCVCVCVKDRIQLLYPSGWSDLGVEKVAFTLKMRYILTHYFQIIAFQIPTKCEITNNISPFKLQPLQRYI